MPTLYRHAAELAILVVTGKDRLTWLNGLVTCDLAKATAGDAVYGLSVAKNGRILADIFFVVEEARVLLAVPRAEREALRAALERYLIMEDAEIAASEEPVYLVDGPGAEAALTAARAAGAAGGIVEGVAVIVGDAAAPLEAAGASRADDAAWEASRIERGVPRFGKDFDASTYPQEASLEKRAVSFSKGCYLGQEVVCMLEMRGHVKRKLVSLAVDAAEPPSRGAVVTDLAGEAVGEVTSAALGPASGRAVALAMVKRAHAVAEKTLRVGASEAKVVRA